MDTELSPWWKRISRTGTARNGKRDGALAGALAEAAGAHRFCSLVMSISLAIVCAPDRQNQSGALARPGAGRAMSSIMDAPRAPARCPATDARRQLRISC